MSGDNRWLSGDNGGLGSDNRWHASDDTSGVGLGEERGERVGLLRRISNVITRDLGSCDENSRWKRTKEQSSLQVKAYVGSGGHDLRLAIRELRDSWSCDDDGRESSDGE